MNAAAYIRVSTDDQIEFSPASQLNQTTHLCCKTTSFCSWIPTSIWMRESAGVLPQDALLF